MSNIRWMSSPGDAGMTGDSGLEIGRSDDGRVWVRKNGTAMAATSDMMNLINNGDINSASELFDSIIIPENGGAQERALMGMVDDIEPPMHIDDIINDQLDKHGEVQWFERDKDHKDRFVTAMESFRDNQKNKILDNKSKSDFSSAMIEFSDKSRDKLLAPKGKPQAKFDVDDELDEETEKKYPNLRGMLGR